MSQVRLAATLLAGMHQPPNDENLARCIERAHRLVEMESRYREWKYAEGRQQLNETPCRYCGEMPEDCCCMPF